MARLYCLILIGIGLISLCSNLCSQIFSQPILFTSPPDLEPRLVGAGSCSASGCHNANGHSATKGSEYSTWIASDPHAQAASVLGSDRSQKMLTRYLGTNGATADPQKEPLCLSCHVFPDPNLKGGSYAGRFSAADGVSCEACHGKASQWVSEHYQQSWKTLSLVEKSKIGFVDTKDLTTRAQTCVPCHVGEKEMDVNHDLIAAGHPRLRFELGSFLANYSSRHWRHTDEIARDPNHSWNVWTTGQVITTKASLDLLAHRANQKTKPWPELSEYNCASCHHNLSGDFGKHPSNGKMLFGTWNNLSGEFPAYSPLNALWDNKSKEDLGCLTRLMSKVGTHRAEVGSLAERLAQKLDRETSHWAAPPSSKEVRIWIEAYERSVKEKKIKLNWDQDTQIYLMLRAYFQNSRERKTELPPQFEKDLGELRDDLSAAFHSYTNAHHVSPENYDPNISRKWLQKIAEDLR